MPAAIDLTLSSGSERSPLQSKISAPSIRNGNAGGYESYEESRPRKKQKQKQSKLSDMNRNDVNVKLNPIEQPERTSKHCPPSEVIDLEAAVFPTNTHKSGMLDGQFPSQIGERVSVLSASTRTSTASDSPKFKQNEVISRPVHRRLPNGHSPSLGAAPVSSDPMQTFTGSGVVELNQNRVTSRPVHRIKQMHNGHAPVLSDHTQTLAGSAALGLQQNRKTTPVLSTGHQRGVYASKNARTPNLSSMQMNVLCSELPSTKEQEDRHLRIDDMQRKGSSYRGLNDVVEKLSLHQAQGINLNKPGDGKARNAFTLMNGKPRDRLEHKDASTLTNDKTKGPENSANGPEPSYQPQCHHLKRKPVSGNDTQTIARTSSEGIEKQTESRGALTLEAATPSELANTTVLNGALPPERPDKPPLSLSRSFPETLSTTLPDTQNEVNASFADSWCHEDETAGLESDVRRNMAPLSWEAIESILRKHIKELQTHQDSFTQTCMARARRCIERNPNLVADTPEVTTVPQAFFQTQSPFTEMKEDQMLGGKKPNIGSSKLIHSQDLYGASKTKSTRTIASCVTTSYASGAVNVPPFTSYIDLRCNVLAENDQRLLFWPYFDDDEEDRERLPDELSDKYIMLADQRPTTILRNERVRTLESYAKKFLAEIGCNLNDVLRCLLDPSPKIDVGLSSNALRAWLGRDKHFEEDFDRTSRKWSMVLLTKLHPSSDRAMATASLACAVFLKVCGFSLWSIAKKSLYGKTETTTHSSQSNSQLPSTSSYASFACRVCQVHNCTHHGELMEGPDPKLNRDDLCSVDVSDSEDGDINHRAHVNASSALYNSISALVSENVVSTGSPFDAYLPDNTLCSEKCFWKKSNRTGDVSKWSIAETALLENVYPACATDRRGPCMIASFMNKPCIEIFYEMVKLADKISAVDSTTRRSALPAKRSTTYWLQNSHTHLITQRAPFYPCKHSGSCETAQCRCFQEKVTCEKTCACSADCNRRFRGCKCSQVGLVCFQNPKCACFILNRECDADLCATCGAAEALDPENRYNDEAARAKCTNVCIQKNMPKRTLLGHSEVHGFGLFMGEPVKAHDYLGEYKGEILTKGESDRRSTIYTYQRTNYTFDLNKDQEIDSTRCGNKFRFINNSEVDTTINCYPKITLCNTVTRIGMFASRDIEIGEELFFNYGYPKSVTSKFWERSDQTNRQDRAVPTTKPDKPRIGRKSATSQGPSIRPRMSNPTTNPADAAVKAQPDSNGQAGAGDRKRELPSRRARSLFAARAATGMCAGGSLLANLGETRDDEDVGEPVEFVDDEGDEDYEDWEEDVDAFSVPGSGNDRDGSKDGGGQETRSRRSRRRGRIGRKRKRSESVDSDDDGVVDGYVYRKGWV